jgi:single-stranded-DNA-specific exonuclease
MMRNKFEIWRPLSQQIPRDIDAVKRVIRENRRFDIIDKLEYGDYGLERSFAAIGAAIRAGKRIALYADYDVDGTMSCVSWIWFFRAIGYQNFSYYIPDRFKEGYGLNLKAIAHLIDVEKAEVIITMDTGITANAEAAFCRARGVEFICTDHHKIQPEKMPDCIVLNPKLHPDERYQELCGCGVTFVLLRKLGREFSVAPEVWNDILALTGMATICDVVPLNGVNHRLAKMGVEALLRSKRPVLTKLIKACAMEAGADEKDIGFRLGPRINAVGRLNHASSVVKAFVDEDPDELIHFMGECNEQRKAIQTEIVQEAWQLAADQKDAPILFLGGDWHIGVVGIAASKVAEAFWRPTWMFHRGADICKGSARSISGFDVTDAMSSAAELFEKFGGHRAAGGFAFKPANEVEIRERLQDYALEVQAREPQLWRSRRDFDCMIDPSIVNLDFAQAIGDLKPFGHGFDEPTFQITAPVLRVEHLRDRQTGDPRHTALYVRPNGQGPLKIMFFNEVLPNFESASEVSCLVNVGINRYRGQVSPALYGVDVRATSH